MIVNVHSSTDSSLEVPFLFSRRVVGGLVLCGLAALHGLGSVTAKSKRKPQAASKPKPGARRRPKRRHQRRPRFKVVTRTFTSTVPITVPGEGAATPYPATIQVGGLRAGRTLDVNVTLRELTSSALSQLDVVLVAPNGRTAVGLMSVAGGGGAEEITLVFDDQAPGYLPYSAPIVSGVYKPTVPGVAPRPETASLRAFNGLNPNGTWRLYVANAFSEPSSIDGWSLTIKARVRL